VSGKAQGFFLNILLGVIEALVGGWLLREVDPENETVG
jgi:uncharacterized membrane protein YeaQ/YmgE (transglycosylase-associated protein family)